MAKRIYPWILLLILAASRISVQPVVAQGLVEMNAQASFAGIFRENHWLPLQIQVRNEGDPISGRLIVRPEISGRVVSNAYSTPIDLPTGSEKTAFLYIQARGINTELIVELLDDDGLVVVNDTIRLQGIDAQDRLYVTVSGPSAQVVPLSGVVIGGYRAFQASWDTDDLPDAGIALDAVDMMIFNDVDTSTLSLGQQQALKTWVTNGGHMIVTGGPNWQGTSAGLLDLLPFTPVSNQRISDLSVLGAFTGHPSETLRGETIIATGTVAEGAQVLASTEELPLIVRHQIGDGLVDYLAIDPSQQPLRGWRFLDDFWFRLLLQVDSRPAWTVGFTDYEQAARAISVLPGVDLLPPVSILCVFLGAYILVIGPLNYLILSRLNKREWAWFTIPLSIVGFSIISWTVGFNLRGSEVTISNLTVVESWPNSDQARAQQLIGLLSPRRATYTMNLEDERFLKVIPPLSQGNLVSPSTLQSDAEIVQRGVFEAQDFSVDGGIFANFQTTGMIARPEIGGLLTLSYNDDNTQSLQGSIRNDSGIVLQNPVVLARGVAYQLNRNIEPGDIVTLNPRDLTLALQDGLPAASPLEFSYINADRVLSAGGFNTVLSFSNDTTIANIMGENYIQRRSRDVPQTTMDVQEVRRRQSFISAFMRDQFGSTARGNRVYLVAWAETAPLDNINLVDAPSRSFSLALYVVELEVLVEKPASSQEVIITPDQFSWVARERVDLPEANPAETMLFPDTAVTFRFTPMPDSVLTTITEMEIQLKRSSSFGRNVPLELWNWSTQQWEAYETPTFEVYKIEDPAPYLGPGNAVEVRFLFDRGTNTARLRDIQVTQRGSF